MIANVIAFVNYIYDFFDIQFYFSCLCDIMSLVNQ